MAAPRPKVFLFYHASMEKLAEKIQALHPDSIKIVSTVWNKFPDGFPDVHLDPQGLAEAKKGRAVCFLSNLSQPDIIFEQFCAMYALPRHRMSDMRVIVPWFSTGTMERVEKYGDVASAKTLARMLSNIPPSRTGPCTVTMYDIHALQEQFYFEDTVLPELQTAIPLLRQKLETLDDKDKISIVYPDDGAHKRFKQLFTDYPAIVCGKERDAHNPLARLVKVKEGDASGRHCIVIDDLVQSGGTLIECAKGLLAAGASKTSCWVTHSIFPKESWKKFTEGEGAGLVHKFWTTDSAPHIASVIDGQGPFEVLSLAPLLGSLLIEDVA